jgi:hypothetical protein
MGERRDRSDGTWTEVTPEVIAYAREVVARSDRGYVKLKNRSDLPVEVAAVVSLPRHRGVPWTAEEAGVVAEHVGLIPEEPWPGSASARWRGVCARAGHETAPVFTSLLSGQGCCRICGQNRTAEGKLMRNLLVSLDVAESQGLRVLAYGRKHMVDGTKHLFLEVFRPECGHTGRLLAEQLKAAVGCGVCHGLVIQPGVNDLLTTHPDLASELADINDATSITHSSNRKVRWVCTACCHSWMAPPNSRTNMQSGCPKCSPRGYQLSRPGALYIVSGASVTTNEILLKVGIANLDRLEERLRKHASQGLTRIVALMAWAEGEIAWSVEQEWKGREGLRARLPSALRPKKADLPDGHTEAAISSDETLAVVIGLIERARSRYPSLLPSPRFHPEKFLLRPQLESAALEH